MSKKISFEYQASINKLKPNSNLLVWLSKPVDTYNQRVKKISFSMEQEKSSYVDNMGNKILFFEEITSGKTDLKIKFDIISSPGILSTINTTDAIDLKRYGKYLKNEDFLEQTTEVKKLVGKIISNAKNSVEKIYLISEYIRNKFKHIYPVSKRGVKNLKLNNLIGDCGEAGGLFVTMCRMCKIPAYNNTGYVVYYDDLKNIYEHGWTSVFAENKWLAIDPMAENVQRIANKFSYEQKNYLITISKGFNIKLKPEVPLKYRLGVWHKIGLPITNNITEILQPLVFAYKGECNFKDSINLLSVTSN